jgi:hypothetical protein
VNDVLEWLSRLPLSTDYAKSFKDNNINGQTLCTLSDEVLDQVQATDRRDRYVLKECASLLCNKRKTSHSATELNTQARKLKSAEHAAVIKQKSKSIDNTTNDCTYSTFTSTTPLPGHIVDILRDENASLKKELDIYYQRVCKLHKLEKELEDVKEAHKLLQATTARKGKLEQAMREKLEDELRKYREAAISDEINAVRKDSSFKDVNTFMKKELARRDSIIVKLIKQNKDVSNAKEKLAQDLCTLKCVNESVIADTTSSIDKQDNNNKATDEDITLAYTDSINKLQSVMASMRTSSHKTQLLESQLRKQLEKRINELQGDGESSSHEAAESDNLKVLTLQADLVKIEHKCVELLAERQFVLDGAVIPRDVRISQLERSVREKDRELMKYKELKDSNIKQLEEAKRVIADLENRVLFLEESLKDKEMIIDTFKANLLDTDNASDISDNEHQYDDDGCSPDSPRRQSLPSLTNKDKTTIAYHKISSPYPSSHQEYMPVTPLRIESLPTYDEHIQNSLLLNNGGVPNNVVMTTKSYLAPPMPHYHHESPNSRSFPNTPEINRRGVPQISAPNSYQGSPVQKKRPLVPQKSLTPPPERLILSSKSQSGAFKKSLANDNRAIRVLRPWFAKVETKSYSDSDESVDSLLSPLSPPNLPPHLMSPHDINKHRHSNSFPTAARRLESQPSAQYGEGGSHSQDSGVLLEGLFNVNFYQQSHVC